MNDRSRLLHILTARGRIRIPALREILARLSTNSIEAVDVDSLRTYKLCRLLDMLGHAEVHRGRPGALCIASPHLGKLPVLGRDRYLLTGARTPITVDDIRAAAAAANVQVVIKESAQPTEEPLAPDRLVIEFGESDGCRRLAQLLGIGWSHTPSSWALACFSLDVGAFEKSLEWHPRNGSLRDIEFYDPSRLSFVPAMEVGDGPFLCRSIANPALLFAVKGSDEARITDADFGRHWALSITNVAGILYDIRRRLVVVPVAIPLPRLLARALCLCSGLAPSFLRADGRNVMRNSLIFSEIPPEIAEKVAQKLAVGFVPQNINTAEPAPQ